MDSHRLLHWRLLIEEFCPRLDCQPGTSNVVGDALSRLPRLEPREEADTLNPVRRLADLADRLQVPASSFAESLIVESFLFYPQQIDQFPLTFAKLAQEQPNDAAIQALVAAGSYQTKEFQGYPLIVCRIENIDRIIIPQHLEQGTIQ